VKDLRSERLANARKRIVFQRDTIAYDIGAPLHKAFANFAHSLLARKEAEMSELFYHLLLAGSIPRINNNDLVRACASLTRLRQIANWCNDAPRKDQQEKLDRLRQLPRRWLSELRAGIAQEQPLESPRTRLDARN
jgi:hypothetical protein